MPFPSSSWVGAGRWPNREAHPDFWGKPFAGEVLDIFDRRAWANSLEFPTDNPHPGEVATVAIRSQKDGRLNGRVPVLWDFRTHREVRWELEEKLRTYKDDVACWNAAKKQKLDAMAHPRRRTQRHFSDFLPEPLRSLYAPKSDAIKPQEA